MSNYKIVQISTCIEFMAHNMQRDGKYMYTSDLLALDSCRATRNNYLPEYCTRITTPLLADRWQHELKDHKDIDLKQYIVDGIRRGFRIGFDHGKSTCKSVAGNMASAGCHSQPVADYLATELRAGRVVEIPKECVPAVQISRFGVIPKASQPGKWRLILDLSSPDGSSVNNGIDAEHCSIAFATVDMAMRKITDLGRGTKLAKVDIEHAYRNVPVHPDDRPMLGMMWGERVYVDTVLPFGLRSAPKIFSSLSDCLEWILIRKGVSGVMDYLDDFLTMGMAGTDQCKLNLELMLTTCKSLGFPIKYQKIEGPSPIITFLGIELNTHKMEARLPQDKLEHLRKSCRSGMAESPVRRGPSCL